MREVVIVGEGAAYVGGVLIDFGWRDDARAAMDAFARRYRAAGWTVHDHRPARMPEVERGTEAGLAA